MLPYNQPEAAPDGIDPEVRGIMLERLQTVWMNLESMGRNPAAAAAFQTTVSERPAAAPQPAVTGVQGELTVEAARQAISAVFTGGGQ